jgi:hypothetical protein
LKHKLVAHERTLHRRLFLVFNAFLFLLEKEEFIVSLLLVSLTSKYGCLLAEGRAVGNRLLNERGRRVYRLYFSAKEGRSNIPLVVRVIMVTVHMILVIV